MAAAEEERAEDCSPAREARGRREVSSEEEERAGSASEEEDSLECRQQLLSSLATLAQKLDFRAEGSSREGDEESRPSEEEPNGGISSQSLCEAEFCFLHDCSADSSSSAFLINSGAFELLLLLVDSVLVPGLESLQRDPEKPAETDTPPVDRSSQLLLALSRQAGCSATRLVELLLGCAANLAAFAEDKPSSRKVRAAKAALLRALPEAIRVFVGAALRCTDTSVLREAFRGISAAAAFRPPSAELESASEWTHFQSEERELFLQAQAQRALWQEAFKVRSEEASEEGAGAAASALESAFLDRLVFVLQSALYFPLLQQAAQTLSLLTETEALDSRARELLGRTPAKTESGGSAQTEPLLDAWKRRPALLALLSQPPFLRQGLAVAAERAGEVLGLCSEEPLLEDAQGSEALGKKAHAFVRRLKEQEELGNGSLDAEKETALEALLFLCADLLRRLSEIEKDFQLGNPVSALLTQSSVAACCLGDSEGVLTAALSLLAVCVRRPAQESQEALALRGALFGKEGFGEEVLVRCALLPQLAERRGSASSVLHEAARGALWLLKSAPTQQLECYSEELQKLRLVALDEEE